MNLNDQGPARPSGMALAAVLVGLFVTLFLEALDQTVVGVSLPKILVALHGFDRYVWAVTAYILMAAVSIPIAGKLSDQFGRKGFLMGGTVLFLLGSILAGISTTMDYLIVSRALQGLGAGTGIALVGVVIADLFPPEERVKWQSLFGVVYGVSSLLGPTLGGLLTDHGPLLGSLVTETTRWRWIFFINLPIGVVVLILLGVFLPARLSVKTSDHHGWAAIRRIDVLGALLSAAGTASLLLGLTWGSSQIYPWFSAPVAAALGGAVGLFGLFFVVEHRVPEPIFPLDLFQNRVFTGAALLSLVQMMILIGLVLYLPFFLQNILATSATGAGLALTPMNVASVFGAALGGALVSFLKKPKALLLGAALILALGTACITLLSPVSPVLLAVGFMALAGLGIGPFFSIPMVAAQNALPATRLGIGTSVVGYLGQMGSVLGAAMVGTVVNNALSHQVAAAEAYHDGFVTVFVLSGLLVILTLVWRDGTDQAEPRAVLSAETVRH